MRLNHLKKAMQRIASSLVATKAGERFFEDDMKFIEQSKANQLFMWLVTETHSAIYRIIPGTSWLSDLIKGLDYAENSNLDYYVFIYDNEGLYPLFPKTIRAQNREENHPYYGAPHSHRE